MQERSQAELELRVRGELVGLHAFVDNGRVVVAAAGFAVWSRGWEFHFVCLNADGFDVDTSM